jgi:hypothetical protein
VKLIGWMSIFLYVHRDDEEEEGIKKRKMYYLTEWLLFDTDELKIRKSNTT